MIKKQHDVALNNSEGNALSTEQSPPDEKSAQTDNSKNSAHIAQDAVAPNHDLPPIPAKESGGQAGPEPTRYGDWEKKGRCTDF